jgi:protein RecA
MPPKKKKQKNTKEQSKFDKSLRIPKGWDDALAEVEPKLGIQSVDFSRASYVNGSLPTGSMTLDLTLGGGIPRGRVVGVIGPEGSGKSTLLYHIAYNAIVFGIPCYLLDHEAAIDDLYLRGIGFDTAGKKFKRLFHPRQPDSGEQSFGAIGRICRKIEPIDDKYPSAIFLIDSIAAMLTEGEVEDDENDKDHKGGTAEQARMLSSQFRRVKIPLMRAGASLVFVNQVRTNPRAMYGNPEYAPGGGAPRFYADIYARISAHSIKNVGRVEKEEDSSGKIASYMHSSFRTSKNKVFPPYRESEIRIRFGKGFDPIYDVQQVLLMTGQGWKVKGGMKFALKDPMKELLALNNAKLIDKKKLRAMAADRDSLMWKFLRGQMKDSTAFDLVNLVQESTPAKNKG